MKTNRLYFSVFLLFLSFTTFAQLKTPDEFLGYTLGERFTPHHRMEAYFKYVAENNPNIKLEYYGETYEHRPLFVAFIASPDNFAQLEDIRKANLARAGFGSNANNSDKTALVWLSYNVHGNEAVSMEASMKTLYDLADKSNEKTQSWLKNTVVIIDPCINPDGRDRYANWYNQFGNKPGNADPNSKEHHEPWLSGRSNHYMFDLNRDWAWLTQIESQSRIKIYNRWLPQVHVDFHEQGYNAPYYFAPAAEPYHEVITNWQREFQMKIGKNNAKYFDQNGWLYFSKEIFDLLYPSYGDTYPVYSGAIGMTFEQGGIGAGLSITKNDGNVLTLKDRIAHHYTTGLSTIETASLNAERLVDEFVNYYKKPAPSRYKSFVIKGTTNPDELKRLTRFFDEHLIQYGSATANLVAKGFSYADVSQQPKVSVSTNDLVIHLNQPKANLVRVLFEPQTKLSDSLTYDITAWTLPYAHNLKAFALEEIIAHSGKYTITETQNEFSEKPYAYLSKWNDTEDAKWLGYLIQNGIKVSFAENDFQVDGKSFKRGTLIISRGTNVGNSQFDEIVVSSAKKYHRNLHAATTGFVASGNDFGSSSVKYIKPPKVAILSGSGASTLSFGEVWHFFEQEIGYPVTILDTDYFGRVNLDSYNVLIIPNGYYGSNLKAGDKSNLADWVKKGNKLILMENALSSFADVDGFGLKTDSESDTLKKDKPNLVTYENEERHALTEYTPGSIFRLETDRSNPLFFGLENDYFSLKLDGDAFKLLTDGTNPGYIKSKNDLVNGFVGNELLKKLEKSMTFGVENLGRGSVIYMADNPLFREFWQSGKLVFSNAVFLVNQR
jgi:hypothetical protein